MSGNNEPVSHFLRSCKPSSLTPTVQKKKQKNKKTLQTKANHWCSVQHCLWQRVRFSSVQPPFFFLFFLFPRILSVLGQVSDHSHSWGQCTSKIASSTRHAINSATFLVSLQSTSCELTYFKNAICLKCQNTLFKRFPAGNMLIVCWFVLKWDQYC